MRLRLLAAPLAAVLLVSGCVTVNPGASTLPPLPSIRISAPPPLPTLPPISPPTLPPLPTPPPLPTTGIPGVDGLLSHIPADIAATCEDMLVAYAGSIEGADCSPAEIATYARYVSFTDTASMDAAFDDWWTSEGADAVDGGLCEDGAAGVGSVTFTDGSPGRYLCYPSAVLNAYHLWWTHEQTNILASAAIDRSDIDPLLDWWDGAGPLLGGQGEVPPVDPGNPPADTGRDCAGYTPAPALTAADLTHTWAWYNSTLYEDGQDYYTSVTGDLDLDADMRWDGTRTIVIAQSPITDFGPGSWTFDGYTLNLSYDDGTDPQTFDTVRVSDPVDEPEFGNVIYLTLEQAGEGTDCTVNLLRRPVE